MQLEQLLTWGFWFTLRPAPVQSTWATVVFIGIPIVLIAFAIAIPLLRRAGVRSAIIRKGGSTGAWAVTLGILALVFTFSRFQGIPFFAARFWWVAWSILALVWGYFIVRKSLHVPGIRTQAQKHYEDYLKYLPH